MKNLFIRTLKYILKNLDHNGKQNHNIENFIIQNKNFWTKYNNSNSIKQDKYILSPTNQTKYITLSSSIFLQILAKIKKLQIIYLETTNSNDNVSKAIRDSFSKNHYIRVVDLVKSNNEEIEYLTKSYFQQIKTPYDLLNLKYKGLQIGDLIYDSVLVYKKMKATIWEIDSHVFDILKKYIRVIYALEVLSSKYCIEAVSAMHSNGIEGLVIRYFANRNIISFAGGVSTGNIRKYSHFNGKRIPHPTILKRKMIDDLYNDKSTKDILLNEANNYIKSKESGQIENLDFKTAFNKEKKVYSNYLDFCSDFNLDSSFPSVFVMLHVFNDYPHHHEKNIFLDYYRWFIETLKIVRNIKDVNWIFKEHPSSIYYPDDANVGGIFEIVNEPHILFLDKNASFNSLSIKHIAHSIITCIGTAGLEYSCFGIPAIIAGQNHYSGFGICYEPDDYDEYRFLLENITNKDVLNKLSPEQCEKARILFYIIYNYLYGKPFYNSVLLPPPSFNDNRINNIDVILDKIMANFDNSKTFDSIKNIEEFILDNERELLFKTEFLFADNVVKQNVIDF